MDDLVSVREKKKHTHTNRSRKEQIKINYSKVSKRKEKVVIRVNRRGK